MEKDAPQIHKVVQAQPSLEIWPFVAVVQTSHTPTLLTNPNLPDNPIIFANDAFLRLTGYGRDEILDATAASCVDRKPTLRPPTVSATPSMRFAPSARNC